MADVFGSKRARLRVDIDSRKATAGAKKVSRSIDQMGKSASRAKGIFTSLRRTLGGFGVIIGGAFAIDSLRRYEQEMSTVKAVTGANAEQFRRLRKEAARLGATTRFTASQAASGMVELARAGLDVERTLVSAKTALALAQAGSLSLSEAAKIAARTLNAFNLEADQAEHAMSVLVRTANRSATTVTELGLAFSYAAPIAASLNGSLEETAAALAVLANSGLVSSVGGTALRTIMIILQELSAGQAGGGATTAFEELGIDLDKVNVSTQGLVGALRALKEQGVDVNDLFAIFARRGAAGAGVVLSNLDEIERFTEELKRIGGVAVETARIMDDNLNGSLLNLAAALESLNIATGESGGTTGLRGLIEGLTEGVRAITRNIDSALVTLGLLGLALGSTFATKGVKLFWRVLTGTTKEIIAATAAVNAASVANTRFAGTALAAKRGAAALAVVMAKLGGPVGVIVLTTAALFHFRQELGLAGPDLELYADRVKELSEGLDQLSTEDAVKRLAKYFALEAQGREEIERLNKVLKDRKDLLEGRTGSGALVVGEGSLPELRKQVEELEKKLEDVVKTYEEGFSDDLERRILALAKSPDSIEAAGVEALRKEVEAILTAEGLDVRNIRQILSTVILPEDVDFAIGEGRKRIDAAEAAKLSRERGLIIRAGEVYNQQLQKQIKNLKERTALEKALDELREGDLEGLREYDAKQVDTIINLAKQLDHGEALKKQADERVSAEKSLASVIHNATDENARLHGEMQGVNEDVLEFESLLRSLEHAGHLELVTEEQLQNARAMLAALFDTKRQYELLQNVTRAEEDIDQQITKASVETAKLKLELKGTSETLIELEAILKTLEADGQLNLIDPSLVQNLRDAFAELDKARREAAAKEVAKKVAEDFDAEIQRVRDRALQLKLELRGSTSATIELEAALARLRASGQLHLINPRAIEDFKNAFAELERFTEQVATKTAAEAAEDNIVSQIHQIEVQTRELRDEIKGTDQATIELRTAFQQLRQSGELDLINPTTIQRLKEAHATLVEVQKELDKSRGPLAAYIDSIEDFQATFETSLVSAIQSAGDAMATFVLDGKVGLEELGQAARSLARELLSAAFQRLLIAPFADFLFGGGVGGGLIGGFVQSFVGSFFTGGAPTYSGVGPTGTFGPFGFARHAGGPVSGRRTYLVGERGPELFRPYESGRIFPNAALGIASDHSQQLIRDVRVVFENSPEGVPRPEVSARESGQEFIMRVVYPRVRDAIRADLAHGDHPISAALRTFQQRERSYD